MALLLSVHPKNPQARLIARAVEILHNGVSIMDWDRDALERLRRIRGIDAKHHLTLMCRDLSDFGTYARVDNARYRLIKTLTPGPYTFILQATRELPKRVLHASRKTIGVRSPDHGVVQALLSALGEPLVSTSLILPGAEEPLDDAMEIEERLRGVIDALIDSGSCGTTPSTVIDLTAEEPVITRVGNGSIAMFDQ